MMTHLHPFKLILLVLIISSNAWCDLHFSEYKGFQENLRLKPEFQYLDPIAGCLTAKQGLLTNMYNYPNSQKGGKSSEPAEEFIQSIFNIPHGTDSPVYFQVSPLAKKFGQYLGPTVIGKVLRILARPDARRKSQDVVDEIVETIENNPDFIAKRHANDEMVKKLDQSLQKCKTNIQPKLDELDTALSKIKTLKGTLDNWQSQCNREENAPKEDLEEKIKTITEVFEKENPGHTFKSKLELLRTERENLNKECNQLRLQREALEYKKEYLSSFAHKLLDSRSNEGNPKSIYPIHFTQQALVALACMNTPDHQKNTLVDLYRQIPEALSPSAKLSGPWLQEKYTSNDYKRIRDHLLSLKGPAERADYLMNHEEEAAFIAKGAAYYETFRLPRLGFKSVQYHHSTQDSVQFTDCMDSSILNFLAIVLRSPEDNSFDVHTIDENLKSYQLEPNSKFLRFTEEHRDSSSLDTLKAHESWVPLIQELPGIQYVRKTYEVDTQISNLFKVMNHLLFKSKSGKSPLTDGKNSEKMDRLCKLLSREGYELDWDLRDGTKEDLNSRETDIYIRFSVNHIPSFAWNLTQTHSEIHLSVDPTSSWEAGLAHVLTPQLLSKPKANASTSLFTTLKMKILLSLPKPTRDDEEEGQIIHNKPSVQKGSPKSLLLSYSYPIERVEDKLKILDESLSQKEILRLDSAKRLIASLPTNDAFTGLHATGVILESAHREDPRVATYANLFLTLLSEADSRKFFLSRAASFDYVELIKEIVKRGGNLYEVDHPVMNNTPALNAVKASSLKTIQYIAQIAPDSLKIANYMGQTPLDLAASTGQWDIVQIIAKAVPSELKRKNQYDESPIDIARNARAPLKVIKMLEKLNNDK